MSCGTTIKKIRESKAISLEKISEKLRIPKNILIAIEDDTILKETSFFYAKSFVKSYAEFIGAVNEAAVKEFLSGQEKKRQEPQQHIVKKDIKADTRGENDIGKYAVIAVAIVVSIWILSLGVRQIKKVIRSAAAKKPKIEAVDKKAKAPIVSKDSASLVESKAALLPVDTKAQRHKDTNIEKKREMIQLELNAAYNTWIQVSVDGEILFRGILKKGNSDTWQGKKEIVLEIGNAGGITVKINGKDHGYTGKKGEKKVIFITPDGIKL